jgi:tRNA G46 methylase TrmB
LGAFNDVRHMLGTASGPVDCIAIQFPDPPHKSRPYILLPQLIDTICAVLAPGGEHPVPCR